MALNNSANYTLSGAQLIELSGKIKNAANTPVPGDATLQFQRNGVNIGSFTANATVNETINIAVPVQASDINALADTTKFAANLTASLNTTDYKLTLGLQDQDGSVIGTNKVIDLPLESVVVSGSYNSTTKNIVLTLESGSNIEFSVADLVSGLQSEINSTNKLSADLIETTANNLFVNAAQTAKLSNLANIYNIGDNLTLNTTTNTLSAVDTTYNAFTGASATSAGSAGLVPAPAIGDQNKFLSGSGVWTTVSTYNLPIASTSDLGGIKVGDGLSINSTSGVLSANLQASVIDSNDWTNLWS